MMNGIRFIHTDHCRLAGSISGLAAAPDWLRRLARDSTRGAVSRVFEIATTQEADFVFMAGAVSEIAEFDSSVAAWLREPIERLRRRGIKVVLAPTRPSTVDDLADAVLRPGERLQVRKCSVGVELSVQAAESQPSSDLVISPAASGASGQATCNYLFLPGTRRAEDVTADGVPVYTAGAPQSHGPHEQGASGCLVVDADPVDSRLEIKFEETDPLRFETRTVDENSVQTSQDICDAVVTASLELARRQRRSTVVDWQLENSIECAGTIESWHQDHILESVRSTLQKGHLGVWPRRVVVSPSRVRLSGVSDSEGLRELHSLLSQQSAETREELNSVFAELITGARLLSGAA